MFLATSGQIQWGDFATWAGAVATLLAVIVALFLGLWPAWEQRRRRPILDVEVGEIEPFERPVFDQLNVTEYRLRLAVTNTGRTTATGVQAIIERWWSWAASPKPWTENPIDPVPAEWVGRDVYSAQEVLTVDIPAGGRARGTRFQKLPFSAAALLVGSLECY
jgi:hypothetical protein